MIRWKKKASDDSLLDLCQGRPQKEQSILDHQYSFPVSWLSEITRRIDKEIYSSIVCPSIIVTNVATDHSITASQTHGNSDAARSLEIFGRKQNNFRHVQKSLPPLSHSLFSAIEEHV
jgi:hypothetical protein